MGLPPHASGARSAGKDRHEERTTKKHEDDLSRTICRCFQRQELCDRLNWGYLKRQEFGILSSPSFPCSGEEFTPPPTLPYPLPWAWTGRSASG